MASLLDSLSHKLFKWIMTLGPLVYKSTLSFVCISAPWVLGVNAPAKLRASEIKSLLLARQHVAAAMPR